MRNETRHLFNAWHEEQIINAFGNLNDKTGKSNFSDRDDPKEKVIYPKLGDYFTIAPSAQVTIAKRQQESVEFLSKINMVDVTEKSGQKLGINSDKPIASTTDTSLADRTPTFFDNELINEYNCTQTNFDTCIPYSKLDTYASQPNFKDLLDSAIIHRQGLDRIMIGFNGVTRAATSDRTANPLLQDVNKGWLQKIREQNPGNCLKEIYPGSNAIKVGSGTSITEGYVNVDALVIDLLKHLMPVEFQDDPNLVVILGRQNISDKYLKLMNEYGEIPSELLSLNTVLMNKRIGGLPAVSVPFFPVNALLITRLDNLSIYYQLGSHRKAAIENAKRDSVELYESVNESYVVETLEAAVMAENIVFTEQ